MAKLVWQNRLICSCDRCGWVWVTREGNDPPPKCSRCRSYLWDKNNELQVVVSKEVLSKVEAYINEKQS